VRYGDTLGTDTPAIDLGNPDWHLLDPSRLPFDTYTERHDIDQSQLGWYAQDEAKWGPVTVVAGLRRDRYRSTDDNGGAPTRIAQRRTSGRLAAIWKLDNGVAPYVNYSTSFEPTSGVDSVTGQAFKPTTAKQIEAGLKVQSPDRRTQLTAAWFDIRKQNAVVNTPTFNRYTQNGEVQSKGQEVSWRQIVTGDLDVTIALTHLDMQVTKNELDPTLVGKTPVWVADKQASAWLNWSAAERLDLSGGVRYIGRSQADALNTATVPGYALVDAAASYRLTDRTTLGVTVSNLADKRYVGACHDANNCWMGAQRSVEMSLSTRF
jgi:iron complex outermembrane receptor protein